MMALVCSVVLSTTSYAAGHTPPPTASVVCHNTGGSAVVVSGVALSGRVFGSSTPGNPVPMANALPPYGPGAPVTVSAGGSATVGPFPVTVGSVAAAVANRSESVVVDQDEIQTVSFVRGSMIQPSQRPDFILMVGAMVFGSDGSRNVATEAGITVSYSVRPAVGTQGGQLIFSRPSNSAGWFF